MLWEVSALSTYLWAQTDTPRRSTQLSNGLQYYNSTITVDTDEETVSNYRKSYLHPTDETWALESPAGFFDGFLNGLGHTAIGISMDINPYQNTAPRHSFEFAFHVLQMHANLVVVSMAHLTTQEGRAFSRMPQEPDMDSLMHWVTRLEPLIRAENDDEVIIVFANRCGTEDEAVYAGTSTIIGIQGGEVHLYGTLGRGDKELLVVDTNESPQASLVYRPDTSTPGSTKRGTLHIEPNDTAYSGIAALAGVVQSSDENNTPASGMSEESGRLSQISTKAQPPQTGRLNREKLSVQTDPAILSHRDEPTVQTPTCPSPTPVALRPRITIPPAESLTYRYLSENGPVMYLKDKLPSIPTLPPPTPDCPEAFYKQPIRILGGEVTLTREGPSPDISISPNSMFQLSADASPFSPKFYWRPPSQLLDTPIEPHMQGWRPPTTMSDATAFTDTSPVTNRSNAPSALSHRYPHDPQIERPDSAVSKSQTPSDRDLSGSAPTTESRDQTVPRPSSPKSRNASRSRGPDRPGSVLDSTTDLDGIAQKLDEIAKRVDSAQSTRILPGVSRGARSQSIAGISSTQLEYPECGTGLVDEGDKALNRPASRASARLHCAARNSPRHTISRGRQPSDQTAAATATPDTQASGEPMAVVLDTPEHPIDLSEFRLIEEFRSPNCPVHGARSNCKKQDTAEQATRDSDTAKDDKNEADPAAPTITCERSATLSPGKGAGGSYAAFEPPTPKAMKLDFDLKSAPLVRESIFKLENEPDSSYSRPKSAVW